MHQLCSIRFSWKETFYTKKTKSLQNTCSSPLVNKYLIPFHDISPLCHCTVPYDILVHEMRKQVMGIQGVVLIKTTGLYLKRLCATAVKASSRGNRLDIHLLGMRFVWAAVTTQWKINKQGSCIQNNWHPKSQCTPNP